MKNYTPPINTSLNNYYNNIYIPVEFLVLLRANKELKENFGPQMVKIIDDAERALAKSTRPN